MGAAALSDAELLAVVLRTGIRGKSAVELGRDLLERFNGVAGILGAEPQRRERPRAGQTRAIRGRRWNWRAAA